MSARDVLDALEPVPAVRQLRSGDSVSIDAAGVIVSGNVTFVDDGWVYWEEPNGTTHATPEKHIRRSR